MGRFLGYSLDGSWRFQSEIVPSLRVMTEHGHAKFVDGVFVTKDALLAETLIGRFPELPGLRLDTRPTPVQSEPEPDEPSAAPRRRRLRIGLG